MRLFVCLYVCVFKYFSETTGPIKAKVNDERPRDMRGKFIQMILVILPEEWVDDFSNLNT